MYKPKTNTLLLILCCILLVGIIVLQFMGSTLKAAENTAKLYQLTAKGSSVSSTSMGYILYTGDEKLIVIDGGYSPEDTNHLLAKLQEITSSETVIIDSWILTHPHNDHANAFIMMMASYSDKINIKSISYSFPTEEFMNSYGSAGEKDTYNSVLKAADKAVNKYGTQISKPTIGDTFNIGSAAFEILWTWNPAYTNNPINESSMVFRVSVENQTILFTGDIGPFASDKLLSLYGDKLKSDVVQMSHHGSNGLLQTAYNAINPSVCLWPTTEWVWQGTTAGASLTTLTTRAWMNALGVEEHYRSFEGDAEITFPITFKVKLTHDTGYIGVKTNRKIYYNQIGVKDAENETVYYEDAFWSANDSSVVVTSDYVSVLKAGIYKLTVKTAGAVKNIVVFASDTDDFKYDAKVFKIISKEKLDTVAPQEDVVLINDYETAADQSKLQAHENASHETVGNRHGFRALNGVWIASQEFVNTGAYGMKIEIRNFPTAPASNPLYTSILFAQEHSTIGAKYYQVHIKNTGSTNIPIGSIKTNAYAYNAYGNACDATAGTKLASQTMIIKLGENWIASSSLPAGYDGDVRFVIAENEQLEKSRGFAFRFNDGGKGVYMAGGYLYVDSFCIVYDKVDEPESEWVKIESDSIYVNSCNADIVLGAYIPAVLKDTDYTLTGLEGISISRDGDNLLLSFTGRDKVTCTDVSLNISNDFFDNILGEDIYDDLKEGIVIINDFETDNEIGFARIRECYIDEPSRKQYSVVTGFGSTSNSNTGSKAVYMDIIEKNAPTYGSAAFSHFMVEQNHSTKGASYYQLHVKYTGISDLTIMSFVTDAYQYTYEGYGQGPNAIKGTSIGSVFMIQSEGGWKESAKIPAGYNGYIRVAIPTNCQIDNNRGFCFRISDTTTGDTNGGQLIVDSFAVKKEEKTVSNISVYKSADKTEYIVGDNFDPTGIKFNVTFSTGVTKVMKYKNIPDSVSFTPGLTTALKVQDTKVKALFESASCDIDIKVIDDNIPIPKTGDAANLLLALVFVSCVAIMFNRKLLN